MLGRELKHLVSLSLNEAVVFMYAHIAKENVRLLNVVFRGAVSYGISSAVGGLVAVVNVSTGVGRVNKSMKGG